MSQQWNHENQFIPWRLTWPLQEKCVEPTSLFLAMLCLDLRLLDGWKNIQTYSQNDKYDHESSGKQQNQSNITKTYTQVPGDSNSKWPFYQFGWKSLNLGKGHLTIPKRSQGIARPKYATCTFLGCRFCVFFNICCDVTTKFIQLRWLKGEIKLWYSRYNQYNKK